MVAIVIMTILGFGVLSGILQARRQTEGSIYQGTATTVAQGYIEQMKNMDYRMLDLPEIDELINQGAEDSLKVSPLPTDPETGDPTTDILNERAIDINNTPDNDSDDLVITYVVYIENITDESNGIGDARRIILRWSYGMRSYSKTIEYSNTLYAIRSKVPTF